MVRGGSRSDAIAKPLMCQFMGVYIHIINIVKTYRIHKIKIPKQSGGSIFHGAIHKILYRNLSITLPRIRHINFLFQKVKHLFTEMICRRDSVFPIRIIIQIQGCSAFCCFFQYVIFANS